MASDSELAASRFAWEDGLRRLAEPGPLRAPRRAIADAVGVELRRRLGMTFTLAELARVYRDASDWYLQLAAEAAPGRPDAWDSAAALDGGFGLFMRQATDAP
ncbi:MAG: hypothetical protein QOK40_1086 [Miltoncostaeaceae bacterium]|nr:hypothetical protein [Miltoncostaeaceae bacterium]